MDLTITTVFYLLVGGGVGVATGLRERHVRPHALVCLGKSVAAIFFWPLFVPLLLERREEPIHSSELPLSGRLPQVDVDDDLARVVTQVEAELDVALSTVAGWSEATLSTEREQIQKLRAAWRFQADRIRELDQLLSGHSFQPTTADSISDDSVSPSERARRENIARLRAIREQQQQDLVSQVACVRELVTMIHLAKYTGAPGSRATELVRQIATGSVPDQSKPHSPER